MKKFTCSLLLTIAALHLSGAAEAPKTKEKAVAASAPAEIPAVELKHKSSFVMDESGRNPFWPIGWKPASKIANNSGDHAGPEVMPSSFLVSSIVMDSGAKFAIVNGKTMQEGQVFGLQLGNQTYQITVKSIEDGRVIFARRDEEIEVLLRRR
ncbi:MAG: hypothetical protein ACR2HH_07455 [Chthoniobacterales bacterium]